MGKDFKLSPKLFYTLKYTELSYSNLTARIVQIGRISP